MAARKTRSTDLSPEVAWYLESRGIPVPDCPPLIRTAEPRNVRGARFDPDRVDRVLAAFGALRHTQGKWAGQPLRPDPWQVAYILAPVFGWVRHDAEAGGWVRIIRSLYVDVPRKNGKSTLAGGIALYMCGADGEQGAQIICAATTTRQAGFVFGPIKKLAESAPALKAMFKTVTGKVIHKSSSSTVEVISSIADAQHGGNLHCSIIDELHVHKTAEMVDVLETGTGSRTQPLTVIITTADSGKPNTVYDRKRRYVEQLSRGALKDPTTYGMVWSAEESDDPFSVATQRKANPGYGVSPTASYLTAAAAKAQNSPADLANYLRLHLGRRTKQETKYIDLAAWDRNGGLRSEVDVARLKGRPAFGGLDLASTTDLAALCWLFPEEPDGFTALWRLWTPEANLEALDKRTAGAAAVWVREKWLTVTPGNVIDYDFIRQQVSDDADLFEVQSIGFDPWNSSQLTVELAEQGLEMVKVRQGFQTLSPPTKQLQRLVLGGTAKAPLLRHGSNPVLRWMVDNLSVAMDPAGNVKPDKANAGDKIDGVAALVIALSEAMSRPVAARSAYETADFDVI